MKRFLILIAAVLCPFFLIGQNVLSALDEMYVVAKGDTWESVATSRGITVEELRTANPDIRNKKKLKKGMLLIVPQEAPLDSPTLPDAQTNDGNESSINVSSDGTSLIRTSVSHLKVGVLLPFTDKKMVEFYRGLLMAADNIRRSGINLDIYAWDSGSTAAQVEPLLPGLKGLDIVFGPASALQVQPVVEACREARVRLVLPFWIGQTSIDYPLLYNVAASNAVLFDVAATKLASYFRERNFVVVRSSSADNRGRILTDVLTRKLSELNLPFRELKIEGDDFAYEAAFNQFKDNVVVVDDSSIPSLTVLMSRLKDFGGKHPKYRFSLLGYAGWQEETERLIDDFFACDTYIVSPYYYNVLDDRIKAFESDYLSGFNTPIVQNVPRYAAWGYDLATYFLAGIGSLGDTFEQMQVSLRQEPLQSVYRFERSAAPGFTNQFVQFVHFTTDSKIELIR